MNNYYLKYLKYKTKYLNLKGGKYLHEGADGIVFRPPLLCGNTEYENENYVGKIMIEESASDELTKSNKIRELDPLMEWSITIDLKCKINDIQTDEDFNNKKDSKDYRGKIYQIISKYGGISLYNKLNIDATNDNYSLIKKDEIPICFKLVKNLIPKIKELNKKYYHNDLHLHNILYNPEDGKIKIFDFGRLIDVNEFKKQDEEFQISDLNKLHDRLYAILDNMRMLNIFRIEIDLYRALSKTILVNPNQYGLYTDAQYEADILAMPDF